MNTNPVINYSHPIMLSARFLGKNVNVMHGVDFLENKWVTQYVSFEQVSYINRSFVAVQDVQSLLIMHVYI